VTTITLTVVAVSVLIAVETVANALRVSRANHVPTGSNAHLSFVDNDPAGFGHQRV